MLHDVVALLGGTVHPFELGVVCEVFGIDRSDEGLPSFDFAVCASTGAAMSMSGGLRVEASHTLERARTADLLVVPAWSLDDRGPSPDVVAVLQDAVERGATVLSVCTGAFLLAAAGLLDGRRATCHWRHAEELRTRFPAVALEPDRLYVADGPVVTSAGTAAGIDACLYLVRRELGARVANGIARRMVVSPHRAGNQAQYVDTPVPRGRPDDAVGALLQWLQAHLHERHDVAALAERVHMSPRTFARRFTAATGTTPHQWITRQRILLAQRLLEEDTFDVEQVAHRSGFGSAEALRHHFSHQLSTTPTAYRRTFSHRLDPTVADGVPA